MSRHIWYLSTSRSARLLTAWDTDEQSIHTSPSKSIQLLHDHFCSWSVFYPRKVELAPFLAITAAAPFTIIVCQIVFKRKQAKRLLTPNSLYLSYWRVLLDHLHSGPLHINKLRQMINTAGARPYYCAPIVSQHFYWRLTFVESKWSGVIRVICRQFLY